MFSSTTIASSMTIPTASVSASIVIELSVKPWYQIRPNVAMIDVGMAIAAMIVERQFQRNTSTTAAARIEPSDEVLLDAVDRGLDELREVANDANLVAVGRERRDFGKPLPDGVDDLDGVRAGLAANGQHHARLAVQVRRRLGFGHAVFDRGDVAQQNLMALALVDDDVAEGCRPIRHGRAFAASWRWRPARRDRRESRRSVSEWRATRR